MATKKTNKKAKESHLRGRETHYEVNSATSASIDNKTLVLDLTSGQRIRCAAGLFYDKPEFLKVPIELAKRGTVLKIPVASHTISVTVRHVKDLITPKEGTNKKSRNAKVPDIQKFVNDQLRKKGWMQIDLEREADISSATASWLCNGKVQFPTSPVLLRLKKAFKCNWAELDKY